MRTPRIVYVSVRYENKFVPSFLKDQISQDKNPSVLHPRRILNIVASTR